MFQSIEAPDIVSMHANKYQIGPQKDSLCEA